MLSHALPLICSHKLQWLLIVLRWAWFSLGWAYEMLCVLMKRLVASFIPTPWSHIIICFQVGSDSFCRGGSHLGPPLGSPHLGNSLGSSHIPSEGAGVIPRCSSECGSLGVNDIGSERGSSEEKESCDSSPDPYRHHHQLNQHQSHHHCQHRDSPHPLECTASTDSLVSRCSQVNSLQVLIWWNLMDMRKI